MDRGNIEGGRQVIDDCIEQRLYSLVVESRAAEHGDCHVLQDRTPSFVPPRSILTPPVKRKSVTDPPGRREDAGTRGSAYRMLCRP